VLKAALQSKRLSLSPSQAVERLPVMSPKKKHVDPQEDGPMYIPEKPEMHCFAELGKMPGS